MPMLVGILIFVVIFFCLYRIFNQESVNVTTANIPKEARSQEISKIEYEPPKTTYKSNKTNVNKTYKPISSTEGVYGTIYDDKLKGNKYWPYYNESDLRNRISNISTQESYVYNSRLSVMNDVYNKAKNRKWRKVRDTYKPVMGKYRFWACMRLADNDSW